MTATVTKKRRPRALKTSFVAAKKRKQLVAKKKAPLVVPTTARGIDDERAWMD